MIPTYKNITISNFFTFIRIILVPFIVANMIWHKWGIAFLLFIIASITDVLDGALARYLGEITTLGAYLDPLADKILLLSCYITLFFVDSPLFKVPSWFIFIVVLKELILLLGGFYLGLLKQIIHIQPTNLGKLTTFIQIIFILGIFICGFFNLYIDTTFFIFLLFIVNLSLIVLLQYMMLGYRGIKS